MSDDTEGERIVGKEGPHRFVPLPNDTQCEKCFGYSGDPQHRIEPDDTEGHDGEHCNEQSHQEWTDGLPACDCLTPYNTA